VAADIEVAVVLPGRVADVEFGRDRDLAIARQQVQLRIDHSHEFFERERLFEDADTRDVQRDFVSLQVEEGSVRSRQAFAQGRAILGRHYGYSTPLVD
jgi:hypothetical protein